jgi:hypothetical protein
MIASLIINPADGTPINEELLALAFADEIKQAQAKYDLLCSQTIVAEGRFRYHGCPMDPQQVWLGPAGADNDVLGSEHERRHRGREQDHY